MQVITSRAELIKILGEEARTDRPVKVLLRNGMTARVFKTGDRYFPFRGRINWGDGRYSDAEWCDMGKKGPVELMNEMDIQGILPYTG